MMYHPGTRRVGFCSSPSPALSCPQVTPSTDRRRRFLLKKLCCRFMVGLFPRVFSMEKGQL